MKMNLLKEIFAHEVFPAIGCTEPISCAYTAAAAAEQLSSSDDGVIGRSPEESINNLSLVSFKGMFKVDPTVVHILEDKAVRRGLAQLR